MKTKSLIESQEQIIELSDSLKSFEDYVENRPILKNIWKDLIESKRQRKQIVENKYNLLKYCL